MRTHLILLLESFPDGRRRLNRLDLLRRLGVLRLPDLLRDDFRLLAVCPSLDPELLAEPGGEFFDDLHDQAEPGPQYALGEATESHASGGRCEGGAGARPLLPATGVSELLPLAVPWGRSRVWPRRGADLAVRRRLCVGGNR
jgi:hypothetical protein